MPDAQEVQEDGELLTVAQAAERVGQARTTLYDAMTAGRLPYIEKEVYGQTRKLIRPAALETYRKQVEDKTGSPRRAGRPRNNEAAN